MEYQKILNLLYNAQNESSKFRTRNSVEINDEPQGMYKDSTQIKFKTSIIKSNLCDCSDVYILVIRTITITRAGADDAAKRADEGNKAVIFKNCVPFTECISNVNNSQIENAKDIDVVMVMNDLILYSDNYLKISGSLWQCYRDKPNDNMTKSESFISKIKITGNTPNSDNKKMLK